MEKRFKKYNAYTCAAIGFVFLSLIGSWLSIINLIPIVITYQLFQVSQLKDLSYFQKNCLYILFLLSILLTIYITIFYTSI